MNLVERVALSILNSDREMSGLRARSSRDNIPDSDGYVTNARAAISEVLDAVEQHLSAVQYDPAPYTALKHRLEGLRKECEG